MDKNETYFAKALDKLGIKYLFRKQKETRTDNLKKITETAIRKWLAKYNYLFSSQEIDDLVQMILDEMDWVSIDEWLGFTSDFSTIIKKGEK